MAITKDPSPCDPSGKGVRGEGKLYTGINLLNLNNASAANPGYSILVMRKVRRPLGAFT